MKRCGGIQHIIAAHTHYILSIGMYGVQLDNQTLYFQMLEELQAGIPHNISIDALRTANMREAKERREACT